MGWRPSTEPEPDEPTDYDLERMSVDDSESAPLRVIWNPAGIRVPKMPPRWAITVGLRRRWYRKHGMFE